LCEGAAAAAKSADVAIVVLAQTSHEGAGESHESDVSRSSETRYFFQFYSINFYYYSIWSSCCQKANKQTCKQQTQSNKQNKQTDKRERTVFHFVVERALITWFVRSMR
jgi:hypothetical protein